MIFILNPNPISLSFKKGRLINMVSELGLVRGHGFETSMQFEYLIPICVFESS